MEDIEREYLTDSIYKLEREVEMEIEFYKPEFGIISVDLSKIKHEV